MQIGVRSPAGFSLNELGDAARNALNHGQRLLRIGQLGHYQDTLVARGNLLTGCSGGPLCLLVASCAVGDRREDDSHMRADARRQEELDLFEAQSQYHEAYMAIDGKKAPEPILGHSALTYRVYCAKPPQQYLR